MAEVLQTLPDCIICKSEWVTDIEKRYRKKRKILPIAKDYQEKFNYSLLTMRLKLKLHFENLHRKRGITKMLREHEIVEDLRDKGVDLEEYRDELLKKALIALRDPTAKIKPTDVAAIENALVNKQKVGMEQKKFEIGMSALFGGFIDKDKAKDGEIIDGSTGILPKA